MSITTKSATEERARPRRKYQRQRQGHRFKAILVPIESSYATLY